MNPTITVDMDRKCAECSKGGAVDNGLCLKCTSNAITGKPMKSENGRAVQNRWLRGGPFRPVGRVRLKGGWSAPRR